MLATHTIDYMLFGKSGRSEAVQDKAANLLVTQGALIELSLPDARTVIRFMRPRRIPAGITFIRQGEGDANDAMLLILEGEATVEQESSGSDDSLIVSVIGPGSLLGEMAILDGEPRSATCIAATDLAVAELHRDALRQLIKAEPAVAARLLLAVSKRMSDRLRETNRKLKSFAQLSRALQQELDATHSVNRRLLGSE